jgi:hypothetical protein
MTLVIASAILWCGLVTAGQSLVRGTITGKVTRNQGQPRGIRVAAHNLDRRLWYTVFTKNGSTSSRSAAGPIRHDRDRARLRLHTVSVQLGPGESRTADLR